MVRLLISLEPRQAQEEVAQSLMNIMRCVCVWPGRSTRWSGRTDRYLVPLRAWPSTLFVP